ncbi:hypothetical protein [Streptomyces sp. A1277]|uniref:hypothetical protein n=1 Tax=Streptomyces sp. A1277 TaxID=2563103 RepID=UPI001F0EBD32|nr:hypothetical protein [Streptomyces sp. A1277]
MAASLNGARIEPGSVVGAATRALTAADRLRPYCWDTTSPRTRPDQLSHAENRAATTTP